MNLAHFTAPLFDLDTMVVWNDFTTVRNDDEVVDTITDSGTATVSDAGRGILVLTPSDGSVADNDEVYVAGAREVFIFAAGRPIYGRWRVQFTETTSGVYNAAVGFANAVAANLIVDDGGGMRLSGSILAVEKRDGDTTWRLSTYDTGGLVSTDSAITAGGASYQTIEIFCNDWDGTSMQVSAKVDGAYLKDTVNNLPIRQTVLIASATEMQIFAGAKLGAATNNDVLNVDYWYGHQLR